MPPELLAEGVERMGYGEKVGTWAVGVVIHQLLTGETPFRWVKLCSARLGGAVDGAVRAGQPHLSTRAGFEPLRVGRPCPFILHERKIEAHRVHLGEGRGKGVDADAVDGRFDYGTFLKDICSR